MKYVFEEINEKKLILMSYIFYLQINIIFNKLFLEYYKSKFMVKLNNINKKYIIL